MDDSGQGHIRPCDGSDFDAILTIVNAAAQVYGGAIPADCYRVPYMTADELRAEIAAGVIFWGRCAAAAMSDGAALDDGATTVGERAAEGAEAARSDIPGGGGRLVGVMGIQDVDDVTLIRHAYVDPAAQGRGVGNRLLEHLVRLAGARPLLVGTWGAAVWAVRFYQRHGFELVTPDEKDRLLRRYWSIPERQVETSVVLRLPAPT